MPTNTKSPYAASFRSAIKRGTPAGQAVNAIAKRCSTRPSVVFNSLHKANICERQKFNGQWVYWPTEDIKTNATNAKAVQTEMWQSLIDWCIVSGQCKPEQLWNNTGSQQDFMTYCKKFFGRQFTGTTSGTGRKTTKRRTTTTAKKKTTGRKRTTRTGRTTRTTRTGRTYRRAA